MCVMEVKIEEHFYWNEALHAKHDGKNDLNIYVDNVSHESASV